MISLFSLNANLFVKLFEIVRLRSCICVKMSLIFILNQIEFAFVWFNSPLSKFHLYLNWIGERVADASFFLPGWMSSFLNFQAVLHLFISSSLMYLQFSFHFHFMPCIFCHFFAFWFPLCAFFYAFPFFTSAWDLGS